MLKICFIAVAFLVGEGHQQCSDQKTWPQFFNDIYCLLGTYRFQKDTTKFNVKNLNDWGKGGEQGIYITKENYKTFLNILSNNSLCLNEDEEVNDSRLGELNNLLEITLRNASKIECHDGTLRISGTFVKFSDVVSIKQCDGRAVERIEVFSTDKIYRDDDNDYVNNKMDFHLAFLTSKLLWIGNHSIRTSNLQNGNYLSIKERMFVYENITHALIQRGNISHLDQDGLNFVESVDGHPMFAMRAADNFVKAITNFKSFLREKLNNKILKRRILPLLTKISTNPRTTSNIDIHAPISQHDYEFFKNLKLLSAQIQLPLSARALTDKKIVKFIDFKNFTESSSLEERKFRGLVVDLNGFLTSIINQLQALENAYSVPILRRIADAADKENRAKDLSTVKRQLEEYEEALQDIAESSLSLIAAVKAEVQESKTRVKVESIDLEDMEKLQLFIRKKLLVNIVGKIGTFLSAIPLTVKPARESLANLKGLIHNTSSVCREMSKVKRETDENDFCYITRPLSRVAEKLVAKPVNNYKELQGVFANSGVAGFLERIEEFISSNYKEKEANRAILCLKAALEKVLEIVDVVLKYNRQSRFENHISEFASLQYGKEIFEGLADMVESDVDNLGILQYKIGEEWADIPDDIDYYIKDVQYVKKFRAFKLMKTIKTIESFIKSETALLIYNNLVNGIRQNTFPYLYKLDVSTVNGIISSIRELQDDRQSLKVLKFDNLKRSHAEFTVENPFYIWKDLRAVEDLLAGKEVVLTSDVQDAGQTLNVLKFNKIGFQFKGASSIFQGEANKIYKVASPSQQFVFGVAVKPGTSEPVVTNSVYDKIAGGDYVLSPFATWKVQIVEGLTSTNLTDLANISLALVGRGQSYGEKANLCSDDLDEYYERVNFEKAPEPEPKLPVPIEYSAWVDNDASYSQCPKPDINDMDSF